MRHTAQQYTAVAIVLHRAITIAIIGNIAIGWWMLHAPPPADMPSWERRTARATHWLFYILMIGISLSGWLYVSTQWRGNAPLNIPTLWFGQFEIPHLIGLNQAAPELRQMLAGIAFVSVQ